MATVFKTFLNGDVAPIRSLLHEAIPITGSIVSGTYADNNIKNYSHGMFQSVFDYPYLSSSANHMFDLTVGYSPQSVLSSSASNQNAKKINLYNQMAQILVGHDVTGGILQFDRDGDIVAGGGKLKEVVFINFARLLAKDEIKKGSFALQLGTTFRHSASLTEILTLTDTNAQNDFRINSPAGEYAPLFTSSTGITSDTGVGLVFYQAGIAVVSASVFAGVQFSGSLSASQDVDNALTSSTIENISNSFRHRFADLDFNNTTELNSTVYFCRVHHNEYNYSSNPTYLSESKIRVKNNTVDEPVSYITSIGLYSADNELLAVAKLSEPIKKTPQNESTFRVRLDY